MIQRHYERYLCPQEADQGTAAILATLQKAQRIIRICAYGFTLPEIVDILIAKHQAGIDVELLLDYSQASGPAELAQVKRLYAASVPFLVGTSPAHAIRHSKIIIVDEEWVEDGSFNYSPSAKKQNNSINIHQDREMAGQGMVDYSTNRAFLLEHEASTQTVYRLKCQGLPAAAPAPVAVQALNPQAPTLPASQPIGEAS